MSSSDLQRLLDHANAARAAVDATRSCFAHSVALVAANSTRLATEVTHPAAAVCASFGRDRRQ
jgi:hypothetical protein